ncbi:YqaE/Pmp3 family membrane protein [Sphingomonas koreensis]|nr:YqaE/Pmp3 family membrane protein [Sphingomonas koreensis]TPG40366.1 YqaE/Pmp3 family membrane protein [Sphingomonas koreensis]
MSASAGQIVAAVLLPPLGAYLARGVGAPFWIACGLTILAYLPGVLFALYTVLSQPAAGMGAPAGA